MFSQPAGIVPAVKKYRAVLSGDKNGINTDLSTHVSVPAFAMMSSTLIGWYRGCADSTRFDTVSPLIGTGGFCARVASWRDLGWGPAEDNRHGACASESNEGFNPEGDNSSLRC